MYKIIYIVAFISLIGTTSCNEDSFSSVVEIELPEHESAIVIASALSNQDSVWQVLVSKSVPIVGSSDVEVLENATATILKNETPFLDLTFNTDTRHYESVLNEPLPSDGSVYKIEVSDANFPSASATQTMPRLAVVENIEFEKDGIIGAEGERSDELTFNIIDASGQDYYAFEAWYYASYDYGDGEVYEDFYQLYLDTSDPLIEEANENTMVLNDASFDGGTYQVRLSTYIYEYNEPIERALFLRVNSLTRESYLFQKSLGQYRNAQGNPFAEPVVVFDNIEEGHGIFRMESRNVFEIEL